jgi:hypothetical protein
MATRRIPLAKCQGRLAIVWFGGCALLLILMILNSIIGTYGDNPKDAWGWFLPTVLPSLSLMAGALMYDAQTRSRGNLKVDKLLFGITLSMSSLYLFLVLCSILLYGPAAKDPVKLMTDSNLWLGPLQGLVTATVGFFFVKGNSGSGVERASPQG